MILDSFRLEGTGALVTGARQNLGQAMALALAGAGADISALDVDDVIETSQAVRAMGRRCQPIACNLRSASVTDIQQVVAETVAELGRLDILVNKAGIIRRAPALDFSEKDWDDVVNINARAVFFMSQAAGRVMKEQ